MPPQKVTTAVYRSVPAGVEGLQVAEATGVSEPHGLPTEEKSGANAPGIGKTLISIGLIWPKNVA
jgi:hypothetical protein